MKIVEYIPPSTPILKLEINGAIIDVISMKVSTPGLPMYPGLFYGGTRIVHGKGILKEL